MSYYGARWYDAKLGRFLSADTIVPGAGNPQAFNRYSYVLNRPLVMIDPTGHAGIGGPYLTPGNGGGSRPTQPSNAGVVTCAGMGCAGGGGSTIYLPIVSNQQTQYTYLPLISNQQYRPTAIAYQAACPGNLLCRPTPTPTIPPWLPTATPGPVMRQGPTPIPTRTPAPLPGFDPWAGANPAAYWAFVAPIVEKSAEEFGVPTVIRAGSRAVGSIPVPTTMLAGWGISLTPNVYKNFSNEGWGAFTGENLYVDLATDTIGFGTTTGLGWGMGLLAGGATIETGVGAIAVAGVVDFTVAGTSSFAYDSWLGPSYVRPWVQDWLFGD